MDRIEYEEMDDNDWEDYSNDEEDKEEREEKLMVTLLILPLTMNWEKKAITALLQ